MKPGYSIENKTPKKNIHWAILVTNWQYLNVVQNSPIIENSFLLIQKHSHNIGVWKLKNLKS